MNFNISDKVVCIDDTPGVRPYQYHYPNGFVKKGQVYCVESVLEYRFTEGVLLSLFIVGCPRFWKVTGANIPWAARRFRKLEDIKEENRLKNSCTIKKGEYIKL